MVKYFTSDTHFSHPLVSCLRGFFNDTLHGRVADKIFKENDGNFEFVSEYLRDNHDTNMRQIADVQAHNRALVENINSIVGDEDELWILGDVSYRTSMTDMRHWVNRLNGRKHMIIGNHDNNFRKPHKDFEYESVFQSIHTEDTLELGEEKFPVVLSHFQFLEDQETAYRQFPEALKKNEWPDHVLLHGHTHRKPIYQYENSIHVGLDSHNLFPISESRVVELIKEMKNESDFYIQNFIWESGEH